MKQISLGIFVCLLQLSAATTTNLRNPGDGLISNFLEYDYNTGVDPINPPLKKINVDGHYKAPDYYPESLKGKELPLPPIEPYKEGDFVKDKFHLSKDMPDYWDKDANAYTQKIEGFYQMFHDGMWEGNHEHDYHDQPGTALTKTTEFGKPESAYLGFPLQEWWDGMAYQFQSDGKRLWDDINQCITDIGEFGWVNHQDAVNLLYGLHNDCEARNTVVYTTEANMRAMELMHNIMTLCGLDYEYDVVDHNKELALKKFDAFVKGPREVFKGIKDINNHIGDSKLRKDLASFDLKSPEGKKEFNRVVEGETNSNKGRHDFQNKVEASARDHRAKARDRFQNEPFHQWWDEFNDQLYEDMMQKLYVGTVWWPQACYWLFTAFTVIRVLTKAIP